MNISLQTIKLTAIPLKRISRKLPGNDKKDTKIKDKKVKKNTQIRVLYFWETTRLLFFSLIFFSLITCIDRNTKTCQSSQICSRDTIMNSL